MDIQNLKNFLSPETWRALDQYFTSEFIARGSRTNNLLVTPPSPAPPPPRQPRLGTSGRSLVYPPALDTSLLAYTPKPIPKMDRRHPQVAIRRDFIAEALKKIPAGASVEEILEHLAAARFPVDDGYYGALVSGAPRVWSSIGNDLYLFKKKNWVRQFGDRWKWIRSKGP